MYKYFAFFITSLCFGQVPFSKENPNNTLAIKGCAYVNLLDGGYGSIIGVEKGFFKNNSIGVKFIYNDFTPHRESGKDDGYKPIDYTNDRDKSFIFEYKYYFNFNSFRERTGISFYSSLSYKTGINTIDNDRNYPHDYYHQEIKCKFIGPAIGVVVLCSQSKRWSIDTQLGYLFGEKKLSTDYVIPADYNLKESYKTNLFRFEIMLAYNIN